MDISTFIARHGTFITDRVLVESILSSDSTQDKLTLATYTDGLEPRDLVTLAKDSDDGIRFFIAQRSDTPAEALEKLTKDPVDTVRAKALANENTDASLFVDAVLTQQFSSAAYDVLCYSVHAGADLDAFKILWEKKPKKRFYLLSNLCRTVTVAGMDDDQPVFTFVDEQIMSQNHRVREIYALYRDISNPEIMDAMKNDESRAVVNAIAGNPNAWASTHEYLVTKHKSPGVRMSVARVTTNNDLLNLIYNSTKSEQIRKTVESNDHFINLATK